MNCPLELIKLIFSGKTICWPLVLHQGGLISLCIILVTLVAFSGLAGSYVYPEYVVCDLIKVRCFLKVTADQVLVFDWIAGSRQVTLL